MLNGKSSKIQRNDANPPPSQEQFDQFSPHTEQMVTCVGGKDRLVISPIIHWSDTDVWEFLNKVVEVPHCSLYDEGRTRLGCILCPMSSIKNSIRDIQRWPHVKENWIKAIMQVRKNAFEEHKSGKDYKNAPTKNRMLLARGGWLGRQPLDASADVLSDPSSDYNEEMEREIAENIFDWWISKKSHAAWYAQKFLQQKIDFKSDESTSNQTDGH